MRTFQRFRLRTPTLGIDAHNHTVLLPAGSVVEIRNEPAQNDPMITVQAGGRALSIFLVDLTERGEEVRAVSA